MFRGAMPAALRSIVREQVATWPRDVGLQVGCSGAYTTERILARDGWDLHSNDVTVYSSAIGAVLARQDFPVTINDAYTDRVGWMADYVDTPVRALATIMIGTRCLPGIDAGGPAFENKLAEYRTQWRALHDTTADRITAAMADLSLSSFRAADVVDVAADTPSSMPFVCFPPPTAGGYEQQFRAIDRVFGWNKPTYAVLDEDRILALVEHVTAHDHWLLGFRREGPTDALAPYLRGIVTLSTGTHAIYSSAPVVRFVTARQPTDPVPIPRLGPGDTIDGEPAIVTFTRRQANLLRAVYRAPVGVAALTLGFVIGEHLVGFAAYGRNATVTYGRIAGPAVNLDVCVPVHPTDYPNLQALVNGLATSDEARLHVERVARGRVRAVTQRAHGDCALADYTRLHYDHELEVSTWGAALGGHTMADHLSAWRDAHAAA